MLIVFVFFFPVTRSVRHLSSTSSESPRHVVRHSLRGIRNVSSCSNCLCPGQYFQSCDSSTSVHLNDSLPSILSSSSSRTGSQILLPKRLPVVTENLLDEMRDTVDASLSHLTDVLIDSSSQIHSVDFHIKMQNNERVCCCDPVCETVFFGVVSTIINSKII